MNIKTRFFNSARELTEFTNNVANGVTAVTAITFDTASAKFVLFYATA